jgi:O-antigen ligase
VNDAAGPEGLVLCALAVAVLGQGAFHPPVQVLVGLLLAAAAARAAGDAERRCRLRDRLTRAGRTLPVVLLGGLGFAAWSVLSGVVAGSPAAAVRPLALLAGVAVVAGILLTADEAGRAAVSRGLLGLSAVVALTGLLGVALRLDRFGHVDGGIWRAAGPLTYANATSAVLAPAALALVAIRIGRGSAAESETDRRTDALLAALQALLFAGLAATGSRGGLVALAIGGLVLAALLGVRRVVSCVALPAGCATFVAVVLAASAAADQPAHPALGVLALLAGPGGAALASWLRLRAGAVPALVGLVALLLGCAALVGGASASGLQSVVADRATLASPDRALETRAALETIRQHPVIGVGPGQLHLGLPGADGTSRSVDYAHDEYLQAAAETGIPGLLLLITGVGPVLLAFARRATSGPARRDPIHCGALAAAAGFLAHSGFDFLWHIPALVLVLAALLALVSGPRPERPPVLSGADDELPALLPT